MKGGSPPLGGSKLICLARAGPFLLRLPWKTLLEFRNDFLNVFEWIWDPFWMPFSMIVQ